MASKVALEIGHAVARKLKYWDGPPYNIPEIADVALAPVRECLEGLIRQRLSTGPCWCPSRATQYGDWKAPGEHDPTCDATRTVYDTMRLKD